jgi:predicted RNA-binding protein associated with RNAse of E/G family
VAWFWDDPDGRWCSADICTPAESVGTRWKYVDLELDVVGIPGGFQRVVDEDEFVEAVDRGFISPEEALAARSCEATIEAAMRDGLEPFATAAWLKRDEAAAMALPATL